MYKIDELLCLVKGRKEANCVDGQEMECNVQAGEYQNKAQGKYLCSAINDQIILDTKDNI